MMNFREFSENVNDEFSKKKKAIDTKLFQQRKQIGDLKKQRLKVKMDQFNKAKEKLQRKMSVFVAGASNFERCS